jgi:Nif-specific regulatory protein
VQSKLLQFLQSKEYFPLGATKPEKADVRLIAATNQNVEDAISKKTFREDLYYRLKVLSIRVPPLEERRGDIAPLCEHFCEETCKKYSIPRLGFSPAALKAAEEADWPGNIRQLAHAVEAATVRASVEGAAVLEPRHLFHDQAQAGKTLSFQEATRRFQKKYLVEILEATQWNLTEAAQKLGLARSHIYNLLQAFELRRPETRKKS